MGARLLFVTPTAGSKLTGVKNDVGHRRGTGRVSAESTRIPESLWLYIAIDVHITYLLLYKHL